MAEHLLWPDSSPQSLLLASVLLTVASEEDSRQVPQRGLLGKPSGGDFKQKKGPGFGEEPHRKDGKARGLQTLPLGSASLLLLDTGKMVLPCLWDW